MTTLVRTTGLLFNTSPPMNRRLRSGPAAFYRELGAPLFHEGDLASGRSSRIGRRTIFIVRQHACRMAGQFNLRIADASRLAALPEGASKPARK
jgi:hypothetical protein